MSAFDAPPDWQRLGGENFGAGPPRPHMDSAMQSSPAVSSAWA
jgi:hypothetical protein